MICYPWFYPVLAVFDYDCLHDHQLCIAVFGNAFNSVGNCLCCLDRNWRSRDSDFWYDFPWGTLIRSAHSLPGSYSEWHHRTQSIRSKVNRAERASSRARFLLGNFDGHVFGGKFRQLCLRRLNRLILSLSRHNKFPVFAFYI